MGLSFKVAVVSATVLSTAVMLKLLAPVMMELAISDLPSIWTSVISWLKPPYLYVVINCIIITIVASSRLQSSSKLDDSTTFATTVLLPTDPVKVVLPVELPQIHEPETPFHGGHDQFANEPVKLAAVSYDNIPMFAQAPEPISTPQFTDVYSEEDMKVATEAYEEITKNIVNKNVISMSSWTPAKVDVTFPVKKPPASARFNHRKPAKTSADGGRTLGVAKPKRQDTLESTWKTITEGRSVPLTRHLRKSDTWETHGHNHNSEDSLNDHNHSERMTKSDTFDVKRGGGSSRKPPPAASKLSRSGGSGRLRKDPSLGQEELNRKVEAFIKKFNEDMRLQRQESLNQYMEMINRGAH